MTANDENTDRLFALKLRLQVGVNSQSTNEVDERLTSMSFATSAMLTP